MPVIAQTPDVTPAEVDAAKIAIRTLASPAVERLIRIERVLTRAVSALSQFANAQDRADLNEAGALIGELRHFATCAARDLRCIGTKEAYDPDGVRDQVAVVQRLIDAALKA